MHGLFQEVLSLLLLPHIPLDSQMFQKVDVTDESLIANSLANTVYENPIPLAAQLNQ